jgi:pimeloyl-ACP methyl ester carboxylesterase
MESGYVSSGGAQIYYETHGEGRPIVFLHAGIADSRMWNSQLDELSGFRLVTFDQRGFGKTNWVPETYADRRDALAVMDHLEIESAVIVGCSLGGGVALHIALGSPERTDGLVLIGAAARGWEPVDGWPDSTLWDQLEEASEAGDLERALELEVQIWVVGHGRTIDDVDQDVIDLVMEMDRIPMQTEEERGEFVEPFEPPTNERLGDIEIPALVMVGAHDQPEMIESAEYLAGRLSDANHEVIPHAAHLPSLEKPQGFNMALRHFLDTLQG